MFVRCVCADRQVLTVETTSHGNTVPFDNMKISLWSVRWPPFASGPHNISLQREHTVCKPSWAYVNMISKWHHQAVFLSLQGHSHGSCVLRGRKEIKSNSVASLSNIRFIHKLICMWESKSVSPNACPLDTGSPSAGRSRTGMPCLIKSTAKYADGNHERQQSSFPPHLFLSNFYCCKALTDLVFKLK